jgi:hypothetical protein
MENPLRATAATITSSALMAFAFVIAAPNAVAGCMPSDPLGHNRFNICPIGFAFSFTQNFDHLNHVRGELQIGDPLQPGVPGRTIEKINGFYKGVQMSGGTVRVTSTEGETTIQNGKPVQK